MQNNCWFFTYTEIFGLCPFLCITLYYSGRNTFEITPKLHPILSHHSYKHTAVLSLPMFSIITTLDWKWILKKWTLLPFRKTTTKTNKQKFVQVSSFHVWSQTWPNYNKFPSNARTHTHTSYRSHVVYIPCIVII